MLGQLERNRNTTASDYIAALRGNPYTGMCRCPAHDDKNPSLHISDGRKGVVFHCFASCSQERVIEALRARGLWSSKRLQPPPRPKQVHNSKLDEYRKWRRAWEILRAATRADAGTPKAYLNGRGIDSDIIPEAAMVLPAGLSRKLHGGTFPHNGYPAMVLPVTDGKRLLGAHVTWLNKDGTTKLAADSEKRTYGLIRGGYIQLCELDPDNLPEKLIVAEGIETTLSASQIAKLPAVAAMSAGNMKVVNLPNCKEIIICGDNDATGQEAADILAQRLAAQGRTVRIALPDKIDTDWNDVLKQALSNRTDLDVLERSIVQAEELQASEDAQVSAVAVEHFMSISFPPRQCLLKPWLTTTGLVMIDAPAGH